MRLALTIPAARAVSIFLLVLFTFNSEASWVTGNVFSVDFRASTNSEVRFNPGSTAPVIISNTVYIQKPVTALATNSGAFRVKLVVGKYSMLVDNKNLFTVYVPNDDLDYDFSSILTNAASFASTNAFAFLLKEQGQGRSNWLTALRLTMAGKTNAVGWVWTATDTLGNGSWSNATGGGSADLTVTNALLAKLNATATNFASITLPNSTNDLFYARDASGESFFQVNSNGGFNAVYIDDSSGSLNSSSGGSVVAYIEDTIAYSLSAPQGGWANAWISSSTNALIDAHSGGFANLYSTGSSNISLNVFGGGIGSISSSGSRNLSMINSGFSGFGALSSIDSIQVTLNVATAGFGNVNVSTSTGLTFTASSGGHVNANVATTRNGTFNSSQGGSINASLATTTNVALSTLGGGTISLRSDTSTNLSVSATFGSASHGQATATKDFTASATAGAQVNYYAAAATNSQLVAAKGAFISVRTTNNVNLGSTNGAWMGGNVPNGTTNLADGEFFYYGDFSLPLVGSNAAPVASAVFDAAGKLKRGPIPAGEVSTTTLLNTSNVLDNLKLDETNGHARGTLITDRVNTEGELHTYDGIFVDTGSGFIDPLKFLMVATSGDVQITSGAYGPSDIAAAATTSQLVTASNALYLSLTNYTAITSNGLYSLISGAGISAATATNIAQFFATNVSTITSNGLVDLIIGSTNNAAGSGNLARTNALPVLNVAKVVVATSISDNGTLGVVGATTLDGIATLNASATHNSRMTNNGPSVFNDTATFNSNVVFGAGTTLSVSDVSVSGGIFATNTVTQLSAATNSTANTNLFFAVGTNVYREILSCNASATNWTFYPNGACVFKILFEPQDIPRTLTMPTLGAASFGLFWNTNIDGTPSYFTTLTNGVKYVMQVEFIQTNVWSRMIGSK